VPLRMKEDYDGAEPSANSVRALDVLRYSRITGEPSHGDTRGKSYQRNELDEDRIPSAVPRCWWHCFDFALSPPRQP